MAEVLLLAANRIEECGWWDGKVDAHRESRQTVCLVEAVDDIASVRQTARNIGRDALAAVREFIFSNNKQRAPILSEWNDMQESGEVVITLLIDCANELLREEI